MLKFIIFATLVISCAAQRCETKSNFRIASRRGGMQSRHPWRVAAMANRKFAHDLYQQVAASVAKDQNFLISPYAVSSGLSMVLTGARNETADQLMTALQYNKFPIYNVPKLYEKLWCQLFRMNFGYILQSVNRMYGEQTQEFNQEFINGLDNNFGAELEKVNFRGDPEEARLTINDWVADVTNDTIQEAMPPDSITQSTLFVLMSTLYFKGEWVFPFTSTKQANFTDVLGESYTTEFMKRKDMINFAENDHANMIKLPYKSNSVKYKIAMELILPHGKTEKALAKVEKEFTQKNYAKDVKKLKKNKKLVYMELPKFRLDFGIDLKPMLENLGVHDLFQRGVADLSGVNGRTNLHIGTIEHKTFLEVNEKGTTAGASVGTGAFRNTATYMIFNRPFLVVIREEETNMPLFMARIAKPQN